MENNNRLNIVSVEKTEKQEVPARNKAANRKQETIARCERLWHLFPNKYNPNRDCMQRERITHTWNLLQKNMTVDGMQAVDMGCGYGVLSEKLHQANAKSIDAVDASHLALDHISGNLFPRICKKQDCLPNTLLEDESYDIVVATDVIGELQDADFRFFFSELARVIKDNGHLVCSTSLDMHSEDALERFAMLAETEFEFVDWKFSFHRFYIHICDFFEAPRRFVQAYQDPEYKQYALNKRFSFGNWWFKVNSKQVPSWLWRAVRPVSNVIGKWLKNSTSFMLFLEKITKPWYEADGATHVIFVGKKRPLMPMPSMQEQTEPERKGKKFVWE